MGRSISHFTGRVSLTVARALLAPLSTAVAFTAQAAESRFSTEPPGAQLCIRSSGVLQCSGVTPLSLDTALEGENESRRYFFRRIGYRTESVLVTAKDRSIRVALKPNGIFFDPEKHSDAGLKDMQRKVNEALHRRIYGPNSDFAGIDAELVGEIALLRSEGRTMVRVEMLITNATRRREIGTAARNRGGGDERLARSVLREEGSRVHSLLRDALRDIKRIDTLALSVNYAKASAVLTEENIQYLRTYVTGSRIRYTGDGKRELITEYTTVRHTDDVTRVVDEIGMRTVLVMTALDGASPSAGSGDHVDRILQSSAVYLNDNRKKTFIRVQVQTD